MTMYRIQIQTWDNVSGDGMRFVDRELTDDEALHVIASVTDPESPVHSIDELATR